MRTRRDLLRSPLDVTSAHAATVALGSAAAAAPTIDETVAPVHVGERFESLIERGELSMGALLSRS